MKLSPDKLGPGTKQGQKRDTCSAQQVSQSSPTDLWHSEKVAGNSVAAIIFYDSISDRNPIRTFTYLALVSRDRRQDLCDREQHCLKMCFAILCWFLLDFSAYDHGSKGSPEAQNIQGPLNGGVSNGRVSRSGLVLPFLSFFVLFGTFPICWDFPDLLGDGPGIFPICPFPLSRPIN